MTSVDVLTILLLLAATGACVAVVWLTREAVATARSLRLLSDDVRERLIPLLEKADVTVDAANAELLRIDGAITRFEDASARVSAASNTLADVVQAPADIVTGVADRVRKAWKDRRHQGAATTAEGSAAPDDETAADLDVETSSEYEPAEATQADGQLTDLETDETVGVEQGAADFQPSDGD